MAGYAEIQYDRHMNGFPVHLPRQIAPFIDQQLFGECVTNANMAIKSGGFELWQKITLLVMFAGVIVMGILTWYVMFYMVFVAFILLAFTFAFFRYMCKCRLNLRRKLLVDKLGEESTRIRAMGVQVELSLLETRSTAIVVTSQGISKSLMIDWSLVIEAGDPNLRGSIGLMPVIMAPMQQQYAPPQYYGQQPQYGQQQQYPQQPPQYSQQPQQYGQQPQPQQWPQQQQQYPPQQAPQQFFDPANPLGPPKTLESVDTQINAPAASARSTEGTPLL